MLAVSCVSPQKLRRKMWALNDSLIEAESSSRSMAAADLEEKLSTINELKNSNSKLLSDNNVRIALLLQLLSLFNHIVLYCGVVCLMYYCAER